MMTRDEIKEAMKDRILKVVMEQTGITRPTLMKLRDGEGNVAKSIQFSISQYLSGNNE